MRLAALALLALAPALTGCESSQEKSAQLEREAKRTAHKASEGELHITAVSRQASVVATSLVAGRESTAAVVTVRNDTAQALQDVPLEVNVRDATGTTVYSNTAPGLARSLTSVPYLGPHAEVSWVDDQVTTSAGKPASVQATLGEARPASGAVPQIAVSGAHASGGAGEASAEGTVANHSQVAQGELVVYAIARRGPTVVAAGRAIVSALAAGASQSFQVFLAGDPTGARLTVTAPPSTLR